MRKNLPENQTYATRDAVGDTLVELGQKDPNMVVLCADLTESVRADKFKKEFPDRFFEIGIAEQNMAGIAAGLALSGKTPFIFSHAIFSPSRNWDQIRASIAFSETNVKICSTHAGFSNGRDGGVAEPLEDIALTRVLPNLIVLHPIDYYQTISVLHQVHKYKGPAYIRLSKEPTKNLFKPNEEFAIGKSKILIENGDDPDVTIVSTGPITHQAYSAVNNLKAKYKIRSELIEACSIKPLDSKTILKSAQKSGRVVTIEEHQIAGGLSGAVCELLAEELPTKVLRIGMNDSFGQSGSYTELLDKYKLSDHHIESKVLKFIKENERDF